MKSVLKTFGAIHFWLMFSVVAGIISLIQEDALICLVSLSILASIAILGSHSRIIHWPIGFAANILAAYFAYIWSWIQGIDGISPERSLNFFRSCFVVWTILAALRLAIAVARKDRSNWRRGSSVQSAILLAIPIALVVLVAVRSASDPARIISGHLSGGDHGAHNLLVHRLISPTSQSELVSPFSVYAYPRAVHYLIAFFTVFDSKMKDLSVVAVEYLAAAKFEYLQLAAMCQASLLVLIRRSSGIGRAVIAVALVIFAMSIDNYVAHAFWSGFTTSLSATWILLMVFALTYRDGIRATHGFLIEMIAWSLFSLLCWVVYQPFVVVGLSRIVIGLLSRVSSRRLQPLQGARWTYWLSFMIPCAVVLSPLLFRGRQSPAVTSLLMDGSLYRPHLWTVILFVSAGLLLLRLSEDGRLVSELLMSIVGLALGSVLVVVLAGGPGVTEQPYYVQKILWVLLFLALPLTLSLVLERIEFLSSSSSSRRWQTPTALVLSLLFFPLATNRTPAAATRHFTVDWFAQGVLHDYGPLQQRAVAFSMRDRLGSHLSNLALAGTSAVRLPVEISLSGNPYAACVEMNRQEAKLVFTTPNGRAELVESGCNPEISYVEEGSVVRNPWVPYFGLEVDREEVTARGQSGFRFLLRGFLPPERWGTWAGGYGSAFGFAYETDLVSPRLRMRLRSHPSDTEQRAVVIKVNEKEFGRKLLSLGDAEWAEVPLPRGRRGSRVVITLVCERTLEETLADDPTEGPVPCAGLEALKLVETVSSQ